MTHHIENSDAYDAATRRNILRNAAIGKERRFWQNNEDARAIIDWVNDKAGRGNTFARSLQEGTQ